MMEEDLIDLLGARHGIVCAVGAGGKKTTLYAIAAAHPGRVAFTATVFTPSFPRRLGAHPVVTDRSDLPAALAETGAHRRIAYARPSEKSGRVAGVEPDLVAPCHAAGRFDLTLVKADGARMRAIKAPSEAEPVIPAGTTTLLSLVSAAAIHAPLDERIAHRPERIATITGLREGEPITADAVGRLLAHAQGGLRGLPGDARAIAVINAVDDERREADARVAAAAALAASPRLERVVLTRHRDGTAEVVARFERAQQRASRGRL